MLRLLLPLALCACVTATAPADSLRGCWIERRGADTLTMRWFPDRERPGGWRGDLLHYTPGYDPAAQVFLMHGDGRGWEICGQDEVRRPPCKPVLINDATPTTGEDYFALATAAERLSFAYVSGSDRLILFDGARDGCD